MAREKQRRPKKDKNFFFIIPEDVDVKGVGLIWKGKLLKKLSFKIFFALCVATRLPTETKDDADVLEELVGELSDCESGEEIELSPSAYQTLIWALGDARRNDKQAMDPGIFLATVPFFTAVQRAGHSSKKPLQRAVDADVPESEGAEEDEDEDEDEDEIEEDEDEAQEVAT